MERLGLDSLPKVTEDEALELMTYHLQMAAIYYMNTPDDRKAVEVEVLRIVQKDDKREDSPQWAGAKAFLDASWRWHEKTRRSNLHVTVQKHKGEKDGFTWVVENESDDGIEAQGGVYPTRVEAYADHDNWINMRGPYAQS